MTKNNTPETNYTDLYTARGSHIGCGACCPRHLPITPAEAKALYQMCMDNEIMIPKQPLGVMDMRCPLIDQNTMQCRIYDKRPATCRAFLCNRDKAENMKRMRIVSSGAIPQGTTDLRELLAPFEYDPTDISVIIFDKDDDIEELQEALAVSRKEDMPVSVLVMSAELDEGSTLELACAFHSQGNEAADTAWLNSRISELSDALDQFDTIERKAATITSSSLTFEIADMRK